MRPYTYTYFLKISLFILTYLYLLTYLERNNYRMRIYRIDIDEAIVWQGQQTKK